MIISDTFTICLCMYTRTCVLTEAVCPSALHMYQDNQYPAPDPTVSLCFGEEFADFSTAKNKLIIVQVNMRSVSRVQSSTAQCFHKPKNS